MMIFVIFLVSFFSPMAFAYIDPGTGSLILQVAIAGIMGALFTIKLYWYKFKYMILKFFGKKVPTEEEVDENSDADKDSEDIN